MQIKQAATVLLLRDGSSRPEVYMLERNIKSEFVSGAYVFPGGAVDSEDNDQCLGNICAGLSDQQASHQVGLESGGLRFWVAAIRECFEECGVLLAKQAGQQLSFTDELVNKRFSALRDALNRREIAFAEICSDEGLSLQVDHLIYFSRWLTPEGMSKRFDTCFFLCPMPEHQTPLHDGHEAVHGIWITPEKALAKGSSGDIKLVPATIKTLESIAGYRSVAELIVGCTPSAEVPTICPQIIRDERGQPVKLRIESVDGVIEQPIGSELRSMMGG